MHNYWHSGIDQNTQESRLRRDKSCAQNKQRLMWMKINFDLGKSGCHRPCGLDSWLIVEVRHDMKVDEILSVLVVHLFIRENNFA